MKYGCAHTVRTTRHPRSIWPPSEGASGREVTKRVERLPYLAI